MPKRLIGLLIALLLGGALLVAVFRLPFFQERFGWRIDDLRSRIKYAISPPEQSVFTPDPSLAAMVESTLAALSATPEGISPAGTGSTPAANAVTAESGPSLTPTPEPSAIPAGVQLSGIRHEYQQWNNCGPANLAMALSFWGWSGDQRPVAQYTKPNPRDKNVMPYELADFVESQTDLHVLVRVGGDLELLRQFIAAGFPVVVEKGLEVPGVEGWMGHYQVLAGYDDGAARFSAYDSYEGDFSDGKTLPVAYDAVETYWRHFNNLYLIIYPTERESEVQAILGPDWDQTENYNRAARRASDEIFATSGRDQFFAWFNRGTNLMYLQDYAGAAAAYDQAFQLYASLDPESRPWRLLWYQTGPYFAYYFTARYWDVIGLATQTLDNMGEPVLEESYYWRGLAKEALGDLAGAIADYRQSVAVHPGFTPAVSQLERLGLAP